MAKEYIEREAFIKNAEARYCDPCKEIGKDYNGLNCRACWVDDMVGDVEDTPAADVAPVVYGMWVYAKTYYDIDECNCSLCGQLMTTAIDKRMNYCPNCGAKMDGGAENG